MTRLPYPTHRRAGGRWIAACRLCTHTTRSWPRRQQAAREAGQHMRAHHRIRP